MPIETNAAIETWVEMVEMLPLYDDEYEVTNLFVWRDSIQNDIERGVPVSEQCHASLRRADDQLLAQWSRLVHDFPFAFSDRGAPPVYWWWHLDRGPTVREDALATPQHG